MDSGTPERFLEAITFCLPKKDILFDNLLIKWCCEPVTISGVWWRFSILEPKKARTPRLNRVRSPSSGGVRQCFDMENVGMLVKFHLHPTRAETDAPPRRYRKGGGFFLKWPNHGTEFSARALKWEDELSGRPLYIRRCTLYTYPPFRSK